MKKIFTFLLMLVMPVIAFGDLLPEPDALNIDEISLTDNIEQANPDDIDGDNYEENIKNDEDEVEVEVEVDEDNEVEVDEDNEVEVLGNFTDGGMSMIAYGFCNEGFDNVTDSLNAAITQQTPFKVCFIWENYANVDLTIEASLVSTTKSDLGNDVCGLDNDFQDFLTSGELGRITIPADNYVIKEFDITFPLGYEGEQKGCLVYNMYQGNDDGGGVGLKVVMRKGLPMNFFVGAIDGIKNEFTVNELTTNIDNNGDLILSFLVENIGNMENTFDIQGDVTGFFGYNKKFEATDGQLAPGRSQYVEINLGSLPSYGGKFDIDFTINGTPYFSYDISNANVDPARLEPKSWTFGTTYFKMPWLILAVVVIFILLLIVLFKKPKQKVVYVQQAQQPQQPVQQPVQQPAQPAQQPQQPQNPNYPQN